MRSPPRAVVASAALLACALASPPQQRQTTFGPVFTTTMRGNATVFSAIPFAAPPLGALRFAAPQPPVPWTTPRDVSSEAPSCMQMKLTDALYAGQEDCLYLSVTIPSACAGANASCPVMVYIFGGAYILGDVEEFGLYDPVNLATSRGVVLVAMQYRLGPFGFTALSSLRAADAGGSTGNAALQDQTLALQWVHDNAAAFGGDANRTTIFGESAGGFSICWHMVSEASAGLFQRAVMESGSCDSPQFFQSLSAAVNFSVVYATSLGCPAAAANGDDAATLACLRALPAPTLLAAIPDWWSPCWPLPAQNCSNASLTAGPGGRDGARARAAAHLTRALQPTGASTYLPALSPVFPWGPAIDGAATGLRDLPLTLMERGAYNKVPFVLGTNENEGSIFVPIFTLVVPGAQFPPRDEDLPAMISAAFRMFPSDKVAQVVDLVLPFYPKSAYPGDNNVWRGTDLITHVFFTCGSRRVARAMAAHSTPAYLYQHRYNFSFLGGLEFDLLGAYHVSEIYFVFGNEWPPLVNTFDATDHAVSDAVQTLWTNFAATGSPNTGVPPAVAWPEYTLASEENLVIQTPPFGTQASLLNLKCDVWDRAAAILGPAPT